MKRCAACILVCLGLLGCAEDAVCDPDPAGWYAIDFRRGVYACPIEEFPKSILVTSETMYFSTDGCELTVRGGACLDRPGFCGQLRWTEAGVYEGRLTYSTMNEHGNVGGAWSDCLIHSEEAILTLRERHPRPDPTE